MLEPFEAAHSVTQLVVRPASELDLGNFKLEVGGSAERLELVWSKINLEAVEENLSWSANKPLIQTN